MKSRYKLMALLPLIAVTSCGYGLKEAVYGDTYNSTVFKENYYTAWPDKLSSASFKENRTLNAVSDKVFTQYGDSNFVDLVDPNRSRTMKYFNWSNVEGSYYGNSARLSNVDESFKYGYLSKLFDGRMFCGGLYQLSRVQINEAGFAVNFKKEFSGNNGNVPYIALNFKASCDYTGEYVPAHHSDILLYLTFYLRDTNSGEIYGYRYSYELDDLETNAGDYCTEATTDNIYDVKSNYLFYGFSLENIPHDRCIGLSVSFDLLEDDYSKREINPLDYSLLIYELFIENVNWN